MVKWPGYWSWVAAVLRFLSMAALTPAWMSGSMMRATRSAGSAAPLAAIVTRAAPAVVARKVRRVMSRAVFMTYYSGTSRMILPRVWPVMLYSHASLAWLSGKVLVTSVLSL